MSLVERITALTERIAAEFRNIQHSQLPSQTGNAGKFLGTDGTSVSWQDVPNALEDDGTDYAQYFLTKLAEYDEKNGNTTT